MSEVHSYANQTPNDNYLPAMNLWEGSCFCLISKNIVHVTVPKIHVSVYHNVISCKGMQDLQQSLLLYILEKLTDEWSRKVHYEDLQTLTSLEQLQSNNYKR